MDLWLPVACLSFVAIVLALVLAALAKKKIRSARAAALGAPYQLKSRA